MKILALAFVAGASLFAQLDRDFLTEDEADQIRLMQEPNERLKLYAKFARLRLELVKQTLADEKPGRSRLVHNNLQDYVKIIEAMDAVIDDALARKLDVQKGVALVAEEQKKFLAALQDFAAKPAKDQYLFEFVLKDAIETTQDSLEESEHDLADRTRRIAEDDERDRKRRESMMTPAEVASRKADEKKVQDKEEKARRKAPTLRRKGEQPPAQR